MTSMKWESEAANKRCAEKPENSIKGVLIAKATKPGMTNKPTFANGICCFHLNYLFLNFFLFPFFFFVCLI